jgi:hypothetical protein
MKYFSNVQTTAYICKPAVIQKTKEPRKLEPTKCKFSYIVCDNNELCKIQELLFETNK